MSSRNLVAVVVLGVALSILTGCYSNEQIKLNFKPASETTYKVVSQTGKDYVFIQPSVNKTKERHTVGRIEMVFAQKIESVDPDGVALANITVKQLKYVSEDPEGDSISYDSASGDSKSNKLSGYIGKSYKVKIAPDGKVEVADISQVRKAAATGHAKKIGKAIFDKEQIVARHQIAALADAKKASKKGDTWSSIAASPKGMLRAKSFEKTYTVTDIKQQGEEKIATVKMNAVPSSKRAENMPKENSGMGFFANMFEENDSYTGQMVLNLTTGEVISCTEELKAEWFAAEAAEEQKSDKGPDQLTMGFNSLYSIEKVD